MLNECLNGIVTRWVCAVTPGWARGSRPRSACAPWAETGRAVERRMGALRCGPEMLSFLQSRGSGGGALRWVQKAAEPRNSGFHDGDLDTPAPRVLSLVCGVQQVTVMWVTALSVWPLWGPTRRRWVCSAAFIRSVSRSVFTASACRAPASLAHSSLSLALKTLPFSIVGPFAGN